MRANTKNIISGLVKGTANRAPIRHTYSRNLLIIERTSPQLWAEEINIWEQYAIRNWQVNEKPNLDTFSFLKITLGNVALEIWQGKKKVNP